MHGYEPALNYFVCTLGQAERVTETRPFETINELLFEQAKIAPNSRALGFCCPSNDLNKSWTTECLLSFKDVLELSLSCRQLLVATDANKVPGEAMVALLCDSTPEFLFNLIGLIFLGHPVLLIAPQCSPEAIASLCRTCQVGELLYDDAHKKLAQRSAEKFSECDERRLDISTTITMDQVIRRRQKANIERDIPTPSTHDVAYLFHTSGTSSGFPKPIPQSHHAAVGVLPRLKGQERATFTTTPLYHGGLPDLFRSWASGAMTWFFPGGRAPVTAHNVMRALDVAACRYHEEAAPKVAYFSAVPYVLEALAETEQGVKYLQQMALVGVGGAALPVDVGDNLVAEGIRLVSRYGSAECGFIMSSHRDYDKDHDWQYLRHPVGVEVLAFESREDGLAELIIRPGWPHMAKTNRDDKSFATSDLFEPHSAIKNTWRYHSRADSQLTLITGKKFDPSPMEGSIAALSLVQDVLIFGNGRPYPGALIFRSEQGNAVSDIDLTNIVFTHVQKLNANSAPHARLTRDMLHLMAWREDGEYLEKSSKGTIIRNKAEERYKREIDKSYKGTEMPGGTELADKDISTALLKYVRELLGFDAEIQEQTELFNAGVDSTASIRLQQAICNLLPATTRDSVPVTIVEDCGNIKSLVEYVISKREDTNFDPNHNEDHLMSELVTEWSFSSGENATSARNVRDTNQNQKHVSLDEEAPSLETIVLTGSTGFLGAHVLDAYRQREKVHKIYCLVRGTDDTAALERVNKALIYRKLRPLAPGDDKVHIIRSRLGEALLGMSPDLYHKVAREATAIVHLAWAVNFRINLRSFVRDHIAGLHNVLRLALASERARVVFCSSTASAANYSSRTSIPEEFINAQKAAPSLGYSRSKWVAEQICRSADENTSLKGRLAVVRVGQLSGDSIHGVWNATEAWPLLLSTARVTGCLPSLHEQPLDWLPVDLAAQALLELAAIKRHEQPVYHLLNAHRQPDWNDLVKWVSASTPICVVEPRAWIERLRELDQSHPASALIEFWSERYVGGQGPGDYTSFETKRSEATSRQMAQLSPVDREYFAKVWRWIKSNVG